MAFAFYLTPIVALNVQPVPHAPPAAETGDSPGLCRGGLLKKEVVEEEMELVQIKTEEGETVRLGSRAIKEEPEDPGFEGKEKDPVSGHSIISVKAESPLPVNSVELVRVSRDSLPAATRRQTAVVPDPCDPSSVGHTTQSVTGSDGQSIPLSPSDYYPRKSWAVWEQDDVVALIAAWGQAGVQRDLRQTIRNIRVFERIAAELRRKGLERSAVQCRLKIKKLKSEYNRVQKSGANPKTFRHYQQLHRILAQSEEELGPAPAPQADGDCAPDVEGDAVPSHGLHNDVQTHGNTQALAQTRFLPDASPSGVEGSGVTKHSRVEECSGGAVGLPPAEPASTASAGVALVTVPLVNSLSDSPPRPYRKRRRCSPARCSLTDLLEYLREADQRLLSLQAQFIESERRERQLDRAAATQNQEMLCGLLNRLLEACTHCTRCGTSTGMPGTGPGNSGPDKNAQQTAAQDIGLD
ncbi:uncharacterized protein LOC136764964 [Amia ocellicauda]|uniref:uncharacterized protein LOC136764964 n=1 Tax=Amia ocellicauda TaxID=2972642 RepID=UPI003463C2F6